MRRLVPWEIWANPASLLSQPWFKLRVTEVYDYKPNSLGKWHKGFPLPDFLQKGGISSQCVVTMNSTSVFMAGGFTDPFRVSGTTAERIEAPIAGITPKKNPPGTLN